jgi:hypothetical protein
MFMSRSYSLQCDKCDVELCLVQLYAWQQGTPELALSRASMAQAYADLDEGSHSNPSNHSDMTASITLSSGPSSSKWKQR